MGWFRKKSKSAQQANTAAPGGVSQASQDGQHPGGTSAASSAQRNPKVEALAIKLTHQREMAQLKAQQQVDRRGEQQAQREARKEAVSRATQRVREWWRAGRKPDEGTLSPLERHRARIEGFEEDRETLPEKAIRYLFLTLAYVLPFIVALAIGKEIGDAYSGTTDFWADGWSIGTHTVAYAGEFSLAMMVLSTAAAFRRYKTDNSYTVKLLWSALFFMLFIAASSLAQWYIAESHIHPKNNADLAALIFRVTMPPAVDIASMLYLSIMGYKSLKKFLAEQQQKAEAIKQLNEAELTIQAAQQEVARRQKEAEQYLAQKQRREELLLRIEEIHSQAMVQTAQQVLLGPGNPRPVRVEEDQTPAQAQPHRAQSEGEEYRIPMPGVRSVEGAGKSNHHQADHSGTYERWTGEGGGVNGDSFRP